MRIIYGILVLIFAVSIASCGSGNSNEKESLETGVVKNSKSAEGKPGAYDLPRMEFDDTEHDFGKILQGEKVAFDFHFVNTGSLDLVISKVSSSCGCTVGNYPKDPVKPGEKGKIEVVFDSNRRKGFQNKTVTVMANTEPNSTMLRLKGVVVAPEKN